MPNYSRPNYPVQILKANYPVQNSKAQLLKAQSHCAKAVAEISLYFLPLVSSVKNTPATSVKEYPDAAASRRFSSPITIFFSPGKSPEDPLIRR
ncbi:hypothetical protein U1Q18_015353 [Sarracenia purpurea var. burkii]